MSRFRAIVALCLAALWLPATLCCAMEAAGWDVLCSSESCHTDDAGAAEPNDGCSLVEDGRYQSAVPNLKVAPPLFANCLCLLCIHVPDALPSSEPGESLAPPEARPRAWVPEWHFTRRTVAPAQAPDGLNA